MSLCECCGQDGEMTDVGLCFDCYMKEELRAQREREMDEEIEAVAAEQEER